MNYTAKRVTKGSKTTVLVVSETGGVTARAGGARAERAQAVVLSEWTQRDGFRLPRTEIELRTDVDAAHKLAASHLRHGALTAVVLLIEAVAV